MIGKLLQVVLLCMFCLAASAAQPANPTPQAVRFISQLSVKRGHLVWRDVRPGMNQREVEGLLGGKLIPKPSASGQGAFTHEAVVNKDGLAVNLGFYVEGSRSILTEIALSQSGLTRAQAAALRKTAKAKLKDLRDSGSDFPLAAPAGEELDIEEGVVRVQIGSDGE